MSGASDEYSEKAKLLLPYFTNQVPAHATYIVTALFGIFVTLIGVLLNLHTPKILYPVLAILCLPVLFLIYSYGRLLYYNESISVLNDILGLNCESTRSDYLKFCETADDRRSFKGFANLIQLEVLCRANAKAVKTTSAIRFKYWLIRRIFFLQRRNDVWKKQIDVIAKVHSELEAPKK